MSDVIENFEVPNQYPIGMRVLALDHDPTCLQILHELLTNCQYQVTKANKSKLALDYVRDKKNKFDLVITQIEMPDMNAFNLLELITLEIDIPVIMISNNINAELMAKAIRHGAYFVIAKPLTKPLTVEMLKNTCLYVYTKHKIEKETCNGKIDTSENVSDASSKSKRKIDDSRINKNRTVWTDHLHGIFIEAIDKLKENEEKVVPKNILKKMEEMEVKYLSRANVASHLQKHRLKDSFNFLQTTLNINRKTRIGMPARRPKTHLPQKSYKNFPLKPITVDQSGQLINNTIPPIPVSRTCSQIPPNDIRKYQQVPSYANQCDAGKYQQVPSYANQSDAGKNQQVLSYANQCDVGNYQQISSDVNHQLGNILQGLSGPLDNFDDLFSYNDNNNNGLPVSAAPNSFLAGNNQESVLSHEFSGFNLCYSQFEMGNVDTNLTGLYRNRNMLVCDDLVMKPAGELNPRTDDSVSVNNSNLRGKENQNQVQSGYEDLSFINDFMYNRRNK